MGSTINSTERIQFYNADAAVKTAESIQTEAQSGLTWCDLASGASYQWRLPTTQELLTVLNVERLRGAEELSSNSDVVLTSFFQHHLNDTGNATGNAAQASCELTTLTDCASADASSISSYYWTGESCSEQSAINASVTAGNNRTSATQQRAAATTARATSDDLNDALNEQSTVDEQANAAAANTAANTAESEATTAEADANTAEATAVTAIADQTHAWAIDFASGQLSCRLKTDTAHVRLVYKEL